jgi:hypothetical protein
MSQATTASNAAAIAPVRQAAPAPRCNATSARIAQLTGASSGNSTKPAAINAAR